MALLVASAIVAAASACSFGALDGFSGAADAAVTDAAPSSVSDAPATGDGAPGTASYPSCNDAKTALGAAATDGVYTIAPAGGATFTAYCDMTRDEGGWMLVTEKMVVAEDKSDVTVVHTLGAHEGLTTRAYVNAPGCADGPSERYTVQLADTPATWSSIRAHYVFTGSTSCWHVFGDMDSKLPYTSSILPFDPAVDVIRDEVHMGGSGGDHFAGDTSRCDDDPANFWQSPDTGPRSATVILRRNTATPLQPGTLGVTTSCADYGPGVTSPTWTELSEIYVR